ncbi:hypothetical protein DRW41_03165 [Neobacillus piezotolerans]|uniref:Uncharacterized protein n=1 Tax=Neobacillus piezotolerans TaxID=2259171 RepID=A0A3D8GVU4_9BACI|nr:hypothetical protein DRW41_03165 [Neobacillus piezotolerans]
MVASCLLNEISSAFFGMIKACQKNTGIYIEKRRGLAQGRQALEDRRGKPFFGFNRRAEATSSP